MLNAVRNSIADGLVYAVVEPVKSLSLDADRQLPHDGQNCTPWHASGRTNGYGGAS
jgi:hypothetical protein